MFRHLRARSRAGHGAPSLPARLLAATVTAWLAVAWAALPAAARQPLAAIVVDARSGKVLFSHDADAPRYPASITKVMTLYLLFRELKSGRIKLSTPLKVSARAASRQPSKLWLKAGSTITVEQAIRALVVKSANDVATVVAENLAGSEAAFAREMTRTARALGMTRTVFRNASGLPRPRNVTTARDLATLSLRMMRDFPQYYRRYFALRTFVWRGRRHRNHNRLLGRVRGMDGLKTGYTRLAGSNLAASVRRNGRRIVAVVLGARSARTRNIYMARLIERTFRRHRLQRGTHIAALAGTPPGWRNFRGRNRLASIPRSRLRPRIGRASAKGHGASRKLSHQAHGRKALDKLIRTAMRQPSPLPTRGGQATARPARLSVTGRTIPRPKPRPWHGALGRTVSASSSGKSAPTPRVRVRVQATRAQAASAAAVPAPAPAREPARPETKAHSERSGVVILAKRTPARAGTARKTESREKVRVSVVPSPAPHQPLTTVLIRREDHLADAPPQALARIAAAKPGPQASAESRSANAAAPSSASSGWHIVSTEPQRAMRLLRTSWNIQIGAFPTREGAERSLKRARHLSDVVRRAVPLTIRVEKGDRVFYRARYTGFRRATATRVCRQLKRRGLACLPLPPARG